ncbi:PIN domain-containing protein [Halogranum amylolyticum]|uniref:PIN domain-containing protein n=1 Tax=Halogranum amylolyticum TaxID=660520 RepID=UPI000A73E32A|nr:PIN domain-containing protein [Halogranum amylolyticum]
MTANRYALETSFIIDYWNGEPFARRFFKSLEVEADVRVPTVALFELYAGALLSDSPHEDIPTVTDDLSFAEPLPLTNDSAQDAARIHADLLSRGNRIQLPDVLNAATARSADATLVATDGHFEWVDDLAVYNPREEQ